MVYIIPKAVPIHVFVIQGRSLWFIEYESEHGYQDWRVIRH